MKIHTLLFTMIILTGTPAAMAQDQPKPEDQKVVIENGAMTLGTDLPIGWDQSWTESGKLIVSRDTKTFHTPPASFSVSTGGAAGKGSASRMLDFPAGKTIHLKGWVKTEGAANVNVFAQAFDATWHPISFQQLAFRQGASDWSQWEGTATMPAGGVRFGIGVLIEGTGQVWLDDVRDAADPEPTTEAELAAAAKQAATPNVEASPPAKASPSTPGWGFFPEYPKAWIGAFRGQLERAKQGKIDVVFLGESLTETWNSNGKSVWDEAYAPLNAVNFGIGGDSTRQVLYRIENGLLDGLTPKALVLLIGTNNLYDNFNAGTDEEIAEAIKLIVTKIREKLPKTKILLLGILPRQNAYFCDRISRINSLIKNLADGKNVHYLDMKDAYLASPGAIKPELFIPDQVHLSPKGYVVWRQTMAPIFDKLVK